MLGPARPAMTAPPAGTIEGVIKNTQGQPIPGVQLTLRAATGWIVTRAASRTDGGYRKSGSLWTLRWREPDSNLYGAFPVK